MEITSPELIVAPSSARALSSVLPLDRMNWVLQRERARCDRNDTTFTLVRLELQDSRLRPRALWRLARLALSAARHTDEIGILGRHSLGWLMPDTDGPGARVAAQRLTELATAKGLSVCGQFFSYPCELELKAVEDENPGQDRRRGENGNGQAAINGNGYSNGNGHGNANGNGHRNGDSRRIVPGLDRRVLMPFVAAGFMDGSSKEPIGLEGLPVAWAQRLPRWKRAIDLIGASLGLIIHLPLMIVVAIVIKLTSPGPILFCQKRAGLGGRPFTMYKFRSMVVGADQQKQALRRLSEQDGPAFKLTRDPRVTRIGRFLRSTSLDELPQLWNVLKGDMSLVGPRPLPLDEAAACARWHRRRLDTTPGITCLWQIRGRSAVPFNDWMRMDLSYLRRRTPLNDLGILLKTIPAVLLRKGAK